MRPKPRESDVRWTIDLFNEFKTDVALWGVPFNHSIYRIDRATKTVELIYGPVMGPNGNVFEQLKLICQDPRLGYTVTKNFQPVTAEMTAEAFGTGKVTNVSSDVDATFRAAMTNFSQRGHAKPQ